MYDVAEGMTKRQQLRYDLSERQEQLERAMGILHHMQQGTDHEATESLARLRIGQSIDSEFRRIQSHHVSAHTDGCGSSAQSRRTPTAASQADESCESYANLMAENQRLLHLLTPRMDDSEMRDNWPYPQQGATEEWSKPDNSSASAPVAAATAAWEEQDFDSIDPQFLDHFRPQSPGNPSPN